MPTKFNVYQVKYKNRITGDQFDRELNQFSLDVLEMFDEIEILHKKFIRTEEVSSKKAC